MIESLVKFLRQSAVYATGNIVRKSLTFLVVPIVTRFMPAGQYGLYSLLMSVSAMLGEVYALGLGSAVTRMVFDFKDPRERRQYLGSIWLFSFLFTLLLSLFLTLIGRDVAQRLLREVPFWPHLVLTIWTVFLGVFGLIPYVILRVEERVWRFVAVVIGNALGTAIFAIIFVVVFRLQALGLVLAVFVSTAIFAAVFSLMLRRMIVLRLHGFPVLRWLRASLLYSIPIVLLEFGWVVLESSDRFLLQHYVSLTVVGYYSLGYAVSKVINYITDSVEMAWAPFFYRTAAEQAEKAPAIFAYVANYYAALLFFLGLTVVLFRHQIIALMAPREYWEAAKVTPVIALASIFRGLYNIPARGLLQQKRTHYFPAIVFGGASLNVALNVLLIPRFGMMGAAWATVTAYGFMVLVTLFISQRVYPIPYDVPRLVRLAFAAGVVLALGELSPGSTVFVEIGWRVGLLTAFPLILLAIGFFTSEERRWVQAVVRRRARRLTQVVWNGRA